MKHDVFVYMLQCADGSYYVGSYRGDRIEWRVNDHNNGLYPGAYTFYRRPVKLVWSECLTNAVDAVALERRLKGWSRAKKEALVSGDGAGLKALAKRRAGRAAILRGAQERAPQDEAPKQEPPHPEAPRSGLEG
jgi:putative endonuclease